MNVQLVHNKKEFDSAIKAVFRHDHIALVQKYIQGKDYRLVVVDKRVISAYERIPLNVLGNGRSTIRQLLHIKIRDFAQAQRDIRIHVRDPRIKARLANQNLTFSSIPAKGTRTFLLDNANLSSGGDSVDVTTTMHSSFKTIAIRLTRDMGLRLCGVDLMIQGDITRPAQKGTHWIIEINAAPGLDHYVRSGREQEKIVEDLYLEVLKSMEHS